MAEEELEDALELIGLVEGTVDDMKQYVQEKEPGEAEIREILEAERNAKNRKTARRFLNRKLEKLEDTSEEAEAGRVPDSERVDREELLEILGGTVEDMKEYVREKDPSDKQLQEILHAEKIVNDRKTAIRFLKSYSKKNKLKEDIREAEHDFRELRADLEKIESEVMDEDIQLDGIDIEDGGEKLDDNSGENKEKEGREEDETGEQQEESENQENEEHEDQEEPGDSEEPSEGKEEETDEGETKSEDSDENKGETNNEEGGNEDPENDEFEKKKDIAEELDVDLTNEQLEDISLGELKAIRNEKDEREKLIDELKDQFDEEKLREASTDDLKKLKSNVEDDSGEEEESEDSGQETEEIKEEAEEDLEMLMGAVKATDKEQKEKKDRLEDLKNLKSSLKEKLSFGSDDEEDSSDEIEKSQILDLLEEYRGLEKYESAIKTAHIMKGYLEYSEGIDREMTYKELADEIEADNESMEKFLDFLQDMNTEQYTGNITAEMDDVINAAKSIVEKRG